MALFRKRPLALAAIALILSVALFYFLPNPVSVALLCVLFVALITAVILAVRGRRVLTVLLVLLLAFCGLARGLLDHFLAGRSFGSHYGQTVSAVVKVDEFIYRNEFGSEVYVRVQTIDGKESTQRAVLRTEGVFPFYIGDLVSAEFLCQPLSFEAHGKGTERTYLGNNAHAVLMPQSEMHLEKSGADSFTAARADLAASLSYRIRHALRDSGGELLSALLIGDSEHLSDEVTRDFRRIGISHLLAISGLHLSVLCGTCDRILRVCRVRKRLRLFATLALSVLYFILTGGSISILRAAFMFGFLQAAFLLRTDNDALTTLSLSAAILTLITPSIIFNLSFLMTMLATFGILAFGDIQRLVSGLLPQGKGLWRIPRRSLAFILSSLVLTVSVSLALLPVQWLIFGELSLLTPLSNLIFVPLALPLLLLAILVLILSAFPAACSLLTVPIGGFLRLVLLLAERLSTWRSVISLRGSFVPYILLPLFIITLILLCVDLKRWKAAVFAPYLVAGIAFSVCFIATLRGGEAYLDAVYQRAGESEAITLYQSGKGVILDLSGSSYSRLYSQYLTLTECGATEVEAIVYTHYHSEMPTALSKFAKRCFLRTVYLPLPTHERELVTFEEMYHTAKARGVSVVVYERGSAVSLFGEISFTASDVIYASRSVEPAFAVTLSFAKEKVRYESSSWNEYSLENEVKSAAYLILGAHGPVPHKDVSVITAAATERVLIGDRDVLDHLSWQGGGHVELFPEFYYFRLFSP